MGNFIHLDPEERKEIVNNIIIKLSGNIESIVKDHVKAFAVTEPQIAEFVMRSVEDAANDIIQRRLRFSWMRWILFK